ncbi:DUF2061 domain-containing protein [Orenia marismortui]|uniref:DUF2061 domain-containing protein n=1 Tax=Orenia marismortui TaxID=46469 RepID=UPI000372CB47|nr:DUF2061 domain-containing protein [Orenia marismortui]
MIKKLRLLKAVTWRITATTTTMLIVYFLTGELKLAGSAALVEIISKIAIYYLHEGIWERITLREGNDIEHEMEELAAN